MTRRAIFISVLVCTSLGACLPSLWLEDSGTKPARPLIRRAVEIVRGIPATRDSPGLARLRALMEGREAPLPGIPRTREEAGIALLLECEAQGRAAADVSAILRTLDSLPSSHLRRAALQAWVDTHPEAALAALMGPDGEHLDPGKDFLTTLFKNNPGKAFSLVADPAAEPRPERVWQALLTASASQGPDFVLTVLRAAPAAVAWSRGFYEAVEVLAAADPAGALAWYRALPPELTAHNYPNVIFQVWGQTDPATAAREWVSSGYSYGSYDLGILLSAWAVKAPDDLYQWASTREGKPELATATAEASATALAGVDPRRALELAALAPPKTRGSLQQDIGLQWSQVEPSAALAWALSLPGDSRSDMLSSLLPQIESLPPAERLAAAEVAGFDTPAGFRVLQAIDPEKAGQFLASLTPEASGRFHMEMAALLLQSSPGEAARHAEKLIELAGSPETSSDTPVLSADQIGRLFSLSSRAQSGSNGGTLTSEDPAPQVAARITSFWAEQDPVAAAEWVATLPPGVPATTALENLAFTWARTDLPAARAWVEQLPAGEAREHAEAQLQRIGEGLKK